MYEVKHLINTAPDDFFKESLRESNSTALGGVDNVEGRTI